MTLDTRMGHPTFWQQIGTGPRPALVVHCTLGTGSMWKPVLEPLGAQITATLFDLPGHGQSAEWSAEGAAPGAYQTLATQIAASFIDRPVDLIGHSFGANVALRLAVAAPEAIRTLTLVEPVLFPALPETHPEWQALRAKQDHLEQMLAEGEHERAARAFIHDWGAGQPWETLPPAHRARFTGQMAMLANISAANFRDPCGIGREGGMEAIDAPVMIVHGDRSPPIIPPVCAAIAERLQDVGTACIPGAGHMIPGTHPAQLSDLIALNLERA
jgi:pimeloyl-ACP methyl ester carboxylesterase